MCGIATCFFFFFNDTATTEIYTLSLHDALPILGVRSLPLDLQRLHPSRLICSHRRRGHVTARRRTARRYDTARAQSSLWHTRNNLMRLDRETPEAGLEPATRRLTAGCSTS